MESNSCYLALPFMGLSCFLLVLYLQLIPSVVCQGEDFVSIDCGGSTDHTDPSTGLMWISDSSLMRYSNVSRIKNSSKSSQQYSHYRYFPADSNKYCYTLSTMERKRYLVRATFLYGSSDNHDTYPKFKLYLDGTRWSDIAINDASRIYNEEMIIRATSTSIYVCLCCASTGFPFISTLELRPLKFSMYVTDFEEDFYLKVAARINFGASSKNAIRYPDDPYDRIWESDLNRRPNFLVGVDPGTKRIATSKKIKTDAREFPPVKVMQTAVVGTNGSLSYRLDLEGFPANARAYAYLAEIENLGLNETRKFRIQQPNVSVYNNAIVNIAENANGSYALYEPSFMNVSLDFVLPFTLVKTGDSTLGPLLNAIEIGKYVQIIPGTSRKDVTALDILRSMSSQNQFTQTNGDPCVPVPWDWVNCSLDTPRRITKVTLSQRNLEGEIPPELKQMEGLTELWLDGNLLTGSIPDLSNLVNLHILHLENNRLTGQLPSYLGDIQSLQELYIENNSLSGDIPLKLLSGRLIFNYDGNAELIRIAKHKHHFKQELILSVTTFIVLLLMGSLLLLLYLKKKTTPEKNEEGNHPGAISKTSTFCSLVHGGSLRDEVPDVALITLADLEEATQMFSKKLGKGSFGPVYYGKMQDGKEVAVKVLADSSAYGTQQFENEVALLSRIHHRNLVPLIGYCKEDSQRILIYEYMHNGTLGNHLHGSTNQQHLDWLSRLIIAEDAAKGLEYLHCGCKPSIIHRDVKTSNILLDINMRAKVSDFGLSRQMGESATHISSIAKGTVGYLDPEYCANQQLSEKSDVYSFGVVLLELISGRKPVSKEDYGAEWSIVHWARSFIHKGNVRSIIDPRLEENFKIETVWRVAEVAILSVEQHGASRPRMQEVVFAIQDAIRIEKGIQGTHPTSFSFSIQSTPTRLRANMLNTVSSDSSSEVVFPTAR